MECEHFSNFRNRFIVTNLRERPNILKLKQIMSAYQKQNLEKLCKSGIGQKVITTHGLSSKIANTQM
jgi:hypothetical protein